LFSGLFLCDHSGQMYLRRGLIACALPSRLESVVILIFDETLVRFDSEELSSEGILGPKRASLTMAHERRRASRFPLIASAEVIELTTNTHLRARISDLSIVGCYLDTRNSLPAGTEVMVHIAHNETIFAALGIIAYCHPNMGMGVRFTDVPLDQHEILEKC
jgi:hypothetical protein